MKVFDAALERFLEPIPTRTPDDVRAARLVFGLSSLAVLAGSSYAAVYLALSMPIAVLGALSAAVLGILTLLRFRARADRTEAGNLLGLTPLVALVGVCCATGGIDSPANAWFLLCPVMPAMVLGLRGGVPYGAAAIGFIGLEYGLSLLGVSFPDELGSQGLHRLYSFIVPVGLILVLGGVLHTYESARLGAERKLRDAMDSLAGARDAAESARDSSRRLLATVRDGLLLADVDGRVGDECSEAAREMFGEFEAGSYLWDLLADDQLNSPGWWELGFADLREGLLPAEVVLGQLPTEVAIRDRRLEVRTVAQWDEAEELSAVLIALTDVTAERQAEEMEAAEAELMHCFLKLRSDPHGLKSFVEEGRRLVSRIGDGGKEVELRRWLHTLKGTTASFGLTGWARWLHELEDDIAEAGGVTATHRSEVSTRWATLEARIQPLLADRDAVQVRRDEFDEVVAQIRRDGRLSSVVRRMEGWAANLVERHLSQLAERGRVEARRGAKPNVRFVVRAEWFPLPEQPALGAFWGALIHSIRNAIDHGVEEPGVRAERGKSEEATIELRGRACPEGLEVEVSDDGRGIDWGRVRERAAQLGLPTDEPGSLVDALFADGLTTATAVSTLSGRGVGTSALRQEVRALGGRIEVDSEPGRGTTFRFILPVFAARGAAPERGSLTTLPSRASVESAS